MKAAKLFRNLSSVTLQLINCLGHFELCFASFFPPLFPHITLNKSFVYVNTVYKELLVVNTDRKMITDKN